MSDASERFDRGRKATRRARQGTRATNTNPRAQRTNPRASPESGTPKATPAQQWLESRERRTAARKRQAMARLHSTGRHWCDACDDTGWLADGHWRGTPSSHSMPCRHADMLLSDADAILEGDDID